MTKTKNGVEKNMIYNELKLKQQAKAAISKNWLNEVADLKDIAMDAFKPATSTFEKHEALKLNKLTGSEEDPAIIIVKCISERHEARTDRGPVNVFDVDVLFSSDASVKAGKYSVWENLTVLKSEMEYYVANHGVGGAILDKQFMIAYYGQRKSKTAGHKPSYIFRVIPYENAS